MGGCVAQAFAGLYPARAQGLALIDTTAWYGADAPQKWRERAETGRTKGLAELTVFQSSRWFGDRFLAEHADAVKGTNDIFLQNDVDCYAATCLMLGDADLRHFLPSIHVPTVVIVGEEDFATPIAMAKQLHEAIAGSTLTIIPKARHLTPIECPEEISSQLLSLFQRVNSQKTTTHV
jgi:pimeloyl-ACP methyl ester carboxylesterase